MFYIKKFLNDENGATAIEYGLIAALISVAIIGSFNLLGDETTTMYDRLNSVISAALNE